MVIINMKSIKFYFYKMYICNYLVVFINKKPKISLFSKDLDAIAILANELIGNIV